jgi:hypothetical protein
MRPLLPPPPPLLLAPLVPFPLLLLPLLLLSPLLLPLQTVAVASARLQQHGQRRRMRRRRIHPLP